jgi:adenylate cyclase
MSAGFVDELLEDPRALAQFRGWSEPVYRDLLAVQAGAMSEAAFRERHAWQRAILCLDLTGFTASTMELGEMQSLLRILDAQKVCLPVLRECGAESIRCFADDVVGLFAEPDAALDAALELQRRIERFNASELASNNPAECCVGIGWGEVLKIGPDLAQGDEMNRASKLGEDIARGREILITERAHAVLSGRSDVGFQLQATDDQLFPFYRVVPAV